MLDQGPLEKVAPSLPVDVGQEIDLKLGEVGLHDSHAGVGKVENVDVVVGGAAKLVGKKVKVRITALAEGMAWAELLSPVEQTLEPLTAESEAEKPTRAKRVTTRKKDEAAAGDADADETVEDDTEAAAEADDETAVDDEPTGSTTRRSRPERPSRPRTATPRRRRRSAPAAAPAAGATARRSRRPSPARRTAPWRPTPTSAVGESDEPAGRCRRGRCEPVAAEAAEAPAGPVIHLPDREIGGGEDDGDGTAPPKKRTRRGSRGGKNRRKKPAGALATGEAEAAVESENGHQPADVVPEPATALIEPEPELVGSEPTSRSSRPTSPAA